MNGTCRYCHQPRPQGFTVTCGNSYCQEADYNMTMAQGRSSKAKDAYKTRADECIRTRDAQLTRRH